MADVSKLRLDNVTYDIKDDNARKYLVMVNEEPVSATKMVVNSSNNVIEIALQSDVNTAIANEITNRNSAINSAIQTEVVNRNAAISSEADARNTAVTAEATQRANAVTALSNQIATLQSAVGSPLKAATKSAMTDTSKIYVYTGSESGMTSGNWYYHNGSAWVSGGVYNAVAVNTDRTLSIGGDAADAKVTGDNVFHLKDRVAEAFDTSYEVLSSGKNIFDANTTNRKTGVYVAYTSGGMVTNANYSTFGIPVIGDEYVSINKEGHFSWFSDYLDVGNYKNGDQLPGYISGNVAGTAGLTKVKSPSNAKMLVISIKTSDIGTAQVEYYYTITTYEAYNPYLDGNSIKVGSIPSNKLAKNGSSIITESRNLLDKDGSNKKLYTYVSYNAGGVGDHPSYAAFVIPVIGGNRFCANKTWLHIAYSSTYFDINAVTVNTAIPGFISGITNRDVIVGATIPSNAKYMVVSCKMTDIDSIQVEYGTKITNYEPYGYVVDGKYIRKDTILKDRMSEGDLLITLRADATGDYTNLKTCLEALPSLQYDRAVIYFEPGTYDVRSWYTNEEWAASGFKGPVIPKNVALIGKGQKRSDVLITCTSETTMSEVSTLHLTDNIAIKNLTVYANNIRYVVHDDESDFTFANTYGSYRDIENVDFIGENLQRNIIYGAGTTGGARWHFSNCRFILKNGGECGFSVHDRGRTSDSVPESTRDEEYIFDNCEFIGHGSYDFRLCPINSGVEETVILNNCKLHRIHVTDQYTRSTITTTTHFNVLGSGNTKGITFSYYDVSNLHTTFPRFSDTTISGLNAGSSTISRGSYCVYDSNYGIIPGTAQNNIGVALNTAASEEIVYVLLNN